MKIKKDGTISKQGEGGGQPPKYKSEQDIKEKIVEYANATAQKNRMLTKAGLLFHLDISRPVYAEYKKKYPNSIRWIELAIEEDWVNRLASTGATGAIFYLKNAFRDEYKDRTETDMTLRTPKPLLDAIHNNSSDKKDSGTQE